MALGTEQPAKPGCHSVWLPEFMLPNSADPPSSAAQDGPAPAVPEFVTGDLGIPVFDPAFGQPAVLGATVPKASIDKNGQAFLAEDKVGSPR